MSSISGSGDSFSINPINSISEISSLSSGRDVPDIIKSGVNALWLLFADRSDPGLRDLWPAGSDTSLDGFALGNPDSPIEKTLLDYLQHLLGTFGHPSEFMNALAASTNPNEKMLYEGLQSIQLWGPPTDFNSALRSAVTYAQTSSGHHYDTTGTTGTTQSLSKILEVLSLRCPKTDYFPVPYVAPDHVPGDIRYTADVFRKISREIASFSPANLQNPAATKSLADLVCGGGDDGSKTTYDLWALIGGNSPNAANLKDPMQCLIRDFMNTPIPGVDPATSFCYFMWQIHDGTLSPTNPLYASYMAALEQSEIPGLLQKVGHFGAWML